MLNFNKQIKTNKNVNINNCFIFSTERETRTEQENAEISQSVYNEGLTVVAGVYTMNTGEIVEEISFITNDRNEALYNAKKYEQESVLQIIEGQGFLLYNDKVVAIGRAKIVGKNKAKQYENRTRLNKKDYLIFV